MRIVLTAHQFLPDHSSGTEIITWNLARELRGRGHDIRIVTGYPARTTLADEDRFDTYEFDGFVIERFHHAWVPMAGQASVLEAEYDNRLFERFFAGYLERVQPDLVHFVHLGRLSASAINACKAAGVPTLFTATDFWFVCPTNQLRLPDNSMCGGPQPGAVNCIRHMAEASQPQQVRLLARRLPDRVIRLGSSLVRRGWLASQPWADLVRACGARPDFMRRQARKLDRILVPSRTMERMLVRNGMPADRMMYLPYGIDLARIERRADKGTARALRVSFIGTAYEHKGVHVLIEAVRSLPQQVPVELRVHARLDEFPDYVERLRGMIGSDSRIELCGPFRNTELAAILNGTDVLVCPSIWYENTPLVIYEAMAAGCPVIASDLDGMAEAVNDGENGLLFPAGDHRALASHVRRLAEDRTLVAAMSARTRVPLSVAQHVDALEDIYAGVKQPRTALART